MQRVRACTWWLGPVVSSGGRVDPRAAVPIADFAARPVRLLVAAPARPACSRSSTLPQAMQGVPHALLLALSALAAPVVAPGLGVQEADGPKKIAMVWDCDNTVGLRLPRGILNNQRPVGGDKNGGPGTGHGLAVNIYSGGVFPGVNSPWAIPQLGNVSVHVASLRRYLPTLIPDPAFKGVCLIDFESMSADFNGTTPDMRQASLLLARNDTALAQQQYEAAARRFYEATITLIRTLRPGCKLGWYGYPGCAISHTVLPQWRSYCDKHPGLCWFDQGGDGNGTGYLGPGAAAMRAINDKLGWLFSALDIITPSVYLGIAPTPAGSNISRHPQATRAHVGSCVREAVRLGLKAGKPVVPVTWLNYDNYWDKSINHSAPRALETAVDAAIELGEPFRSGADGILIWGHLDNISGSTNNLHSYQSYSDTVLRSTVDNICRNYSCCMSLDGCWDKSGP